MNDASQSDAPGEAAIDRQAAAWVARSDRGLTAVEQDALFQWLAEDPRHGEWLARHRRTAKSLRLLAQWRPEHGARPNPDLLAQPQTRAHRPWWWPLGLAAAAAITLAAIWGTLGPAQPGDATFARGAAETTTVRRQTLADGSVVTLNRGAAITVAFTAAERRVTLVRGEASFDVAKHPDRPFLVQAGSVEVRAVGTAFNVLFAAERVEVLVTEGRVRVRPAATLPAEAPLVTAGQQAVVALGVTDAAPHISEIAAGEISRRMEWRVRQLKFVDTPLAQVAAEFNRDNHVKLVVNDPELAALPIGATLRSDNVEGFVRVLETSFGVAAERRGDGVIVLSRARR